MPKPKKRPAPFAERLEQAKRASAAQLLIRAGRLVDARGLALLRESTRQADRLALGPRHTRLMPHIDLEGTRSADIARRAGITKQAVNQTLQELEDAGIVEKRQDPEDGRAKRIHFTKQGQRALLQGVGILQRVDQQLESELGEPRLERLRGDLQALVTHLEKKTN